VSDIAAPGRRLAWPDPPTAPATVTGAVVSRADSAQPDTRRALQLALAGCWLLDAVLQYQPAMFSRAFSDMLGGTAAGNPSVIARPITWDANLVGHHLVPLNTVFATVQLLLGLGIAFRPTVRPALAASIAWAIGVWWLGEGLGGVLSGTASPLNGAPGAVILYALLAVLLWPSDRLRWPSDRLRWPSDQLPWPGSRSTAAPFAAAKAVPAAVARALWLVLWLSLGYFSLTPANRAPRAMSAAITSMASGEPRWLTALDSRAATLIGSHGLAASVALATACAVIAVGVYLPRRAAIAALLLALAVATAIWVFGQALGAILVGGATDPNSGPLLALLALAYWPPAPARSRGRHRRRSRRQYTVAAGGTEAC
jgi:hypothetical protein